MTIVFLLILLFSFQKDFTPHDTSGHTLDRSKGDNVAAIRCDAGSERDAPDGLRKPPASREATLPYGGTARLGTIEREDGRVR